jgi:hypothetical protein
MPGLRELNLACWGLFLGFVVFPLFVPIFYDLKTGSAFIHLLPVDFTYFYGIGKIVNEYSFSRLYDYSLQLTIFNGIYPLRGHTYGPSPYPPFVALFFSLFARLTFMEAYLVWLATSLALYCAGIASVIKVAYPKDRLRASLIFCCSLGFYPFFICTLKLGQLSAIAVFSVGVAIFQEHKGRPFTSGLALAILTYKPTLLFLLVPMLLITRRIRAFLGFLTGASILILLVTAFAGLDIWSTYAHFLTFFQQVSVYRGQSLLQLWEYVDLTSLSYSIPGGRSAIALTVLASLTIAILAVLAALSWKSAAHRAPVQYLVWSATLTWTLVLNLYVPVWDSILVVVAVILTLGALRTLVWGEAGQWVGLLAISIFAVTWNLAAKGNQHGSQWMTILLFLLGSTQLFLLYRAIRQGSLQGNQQRA